ncbi:MAG: hypothetical protein GAK28_01264 [Luteibacter sp.]|uniref:carbapenem self-resistance protein CarG family protein n=1 Tax=Luteibacter sp. TaxID=1886636 RepID=UPI00137DDDD6|nr:hypothetical protein [Luteibacter sp.]KAF1008283.1 MAG: hypothetical protein GAK28_01264 [Luteibacter sp.]
MRLAPWLAAALFVTCAAQADSVGAPRVIPVNNGPNDITLAGQPAMAMRAWRENFNAHGFDVISFYVRESSEGKSTWNLVPVFSNSPKGGDDEKLTIGVSGGADCTLHDFRLLRSADGKTETLVIAQRDAGESYADAALVHFTWYNLTKNEDGLVGYPALYFKQARETQAKKRYCDVNEAFQHELHFGKRSGTGGPEH